MWLWQVLAALQVSCEACASDSGRTLPLPSEGPIPASLAMLKGEAAIRSTIQCLPPSPYTLHRFPGARSPSSPKHSHCQQWPGRTPYTRRRQQFPVKALQTLDGTRLSARRSLSLSTSIEYLSTYIYIYVCIYYTCTHCVYIYIFFFLGYYGYYVHISYIYMYICIRVKLNSLLVSEIMCSWGNDMSVGMVVTNNIHHGPYRISTARARKVKDIQNDMKLACLYPPYSWRWTSSWNQYTPPFRHRGSCDMGVEVLPTTRSWCWQQPSRAWAEIWL